MNSFLTDQADLFQGLKGGRLPLEMLKLPPRRHLCPKPPSWGSVTLKLKTAWAWLKWNGNLGLRSLSSKKDIFVVSNARTFLFFLPAVLLHKLLGSKVVWRIQARPSAPSMVKAVLFLMSSLVVVHGGRRMARGIFPAGPWQNLIFPRKKIRISRNSIYVDAYRQAFDSLGLDPDPHFFKLCMVSAMEREKGVMEALRGLKFLMDNGVNAILVHSRTATGNDPAYAREVQVYIHQHKLARRVKLMGPVQNPAGIIGSSDVNLLPSLAEDQPLVITEASCLSVPSIAYDVGGVNEQVLNGESGYLVPPGDRRAMEKRLLFLARNPEFRRQMGHRAFSHVKQYFDFQTNTRFILKELVALSSS